jgi:predicted porin
MEIEMIGGLMKTTSRFAMVAAAGLLMGGYSLPASAADLGGDCCSDLEERVAELEATTARKGNRKVSLEVSGQVNRALLVWDDGQDSDAYIVDNDLTGSRFRFKGSAVMKPGWKAGFLIEIETQDAASNEVSQLDDEGRGGEAGNILTRQANWYVESERYGRITVGHQSPATDDLTLINLSNSLSVGDLYFNNAFAIRTTGGGNSGLTWSQVASGEDTARGDYVRYDTPSIYGFIVSTAWGENDSWDAAIRYQKEWNSIRFAGGVGYFYNGDFGLVNDKIEEVKGSASIMHIPTGLYVNFAAGNRDQDSHDDTASFWYTQVGLQKRFMPYGATTIWGEYGQYNDYASGLTNGLNTITGSEVNRWGFGVTQAFDSAALELYAQYYHYDADVDTVDNLGARTNLNLEDWSAGLFGARIKF